VDVVPKMEGGVLIRIHRGYAMGLRKAYSPSVCLSAQDHKPCLTLEKCCCIG
jgi:hypothetical protein